MRISSLVIAAAAMSCLAGTCYAATLQDVQGQVSVNQGRGYQLVRSGAVANPGDIVMASPGSSAEVVYSDGCVMRIDPGAIVTVPEQSPCVRGQANYMPYVIGAAAVAGITAGVIAANKNDSSGFTPPKPASP